MNTSLGATLPANRARSWLEETARDLWQDSSSPAAAPHPFMWLGTRDLLDVVSLVGLVVEPYARLTEASGVFGVCLESSTESAAATGTAVLDVWTFLEMTGLGDVHTLARQAMRSLGDAVEDVEVALGEEEDLGGAFAELRVYLRSENREQFWELRSAAMAALLESLRGRDLTRLVIALLPDARLSRVRP